MKFFINIFFAVFLVISCNNSSNNEQLKVYTFKIEGMTCEVGCAGLIKRKLSKIDGVKSVEVNFKKEKATISYQPLVISQSEIDEFVNNIAGGIYKVVKD